MESEPTSGTVPVHHAIADALRRRIETGDLRPGDSLPSVRELEEEHGTSANTVRAALAVLREEGRINAGRGKPATVREPVERQRINLTSTWSDEQKQLVLRPRAERETRGAIEMISGIPIKDIDSFHDYEVVPAVDELALEFGIEPGTPLQQRTYEMRRKGGGNRLSWSVSYIPLHLIEAYPPLLDDNEEPWPGGHQHQLYTVGIELDAFRRTMTAVQPTPGERQRWGIAQGVPMIRIRSRSIDVDGRVVEVSDAVYPADRTEIELVEQLTRWPADYPRFDRERGDA